MDCMAFWSSLPPVAFHAVGIVLTTSPKALGLRDRAGRMKNNENEKRTIVIVRFICDDDSKNSDQFLDNMILKRRTLDQVFE